MYVLHAGEFCRFFGLLVFFKVNVFRNTIRVSKSLVLWTSVLSSLIWVQTIGKGYQQTTLAGNELKVNAKKKKNPVGFWTNFSLLGCLNELIVLSER